MTRIWSIRTTVNADSCNLFGDFFEAHFFSAITFSKIDGSNLWEINAFSTSRPNKFHIKNELSIVCQLNNLFMPKLDFFDNAKYNEDDHTFEYSYPIKIGQICVTDPQNNSNQREKATIRLETKNTFGSGHHESTNGCLRILQTLRKTEQFKNILDMGCGNGILSLASAKLWHSNILAIDKEKECVEITKNNIALNQLCSRVQAHHANGYRLGLIRKKKPFDLIICNLLAKPLISMSRDLEKNLLLTGETVGHALLSGILDKQSNRVIAAHVNRGLKLVKRSRINHWQTLLFKRQNQ